MRLDDELRQDLNREYVRLADCDKVQEGNVRKFNNDDKRLAIIETYQKLTLAVMGAIGVGVLGLVLNQFWGL